VRQRPIRYSGDIEYLKPALRAQWLKGPETPSRYRSGAITVEPPEGGVCHDPSDSARAPRREEYRRGEIGLRARAIPSASMASATIRVKPGLGAAIMTWLAGHGSVAGHHREPGGGASSRGRSMETPRPVVC